MTSLHSEDWLRNRRFGIVIDAGSSGSRIHIYSWINTQHLQDTAPARDFYGVLPTIEPGVESGSLNSADWTKKTEPGIADFKHRPEDVGEHLEPLLDHALEVIPESEIARTPIYLLATAGLRLVKEDIRQEILANSCSYIKENYSFQIGECKEHIKNIAGEEEGIYGWVAINYLMGGFDNGGVKMIKPAVPGSEQHDDMDGTGAGANRDSLPVVDIHGSEDGSGSGDDINGDPTPHRHTLGFLDMGGASTQIAFEPSPKASEDHANDLTRVSLKTLDGQTLNYNVFVTTFLGYGSNEARRRYVKDYLLSANKDWLETQKPGVQVTIEDPCLPKHLQISETHTVPHVPLMGSGSFKECLERVEVLLNKDTECSDKPCLFNGVHTPPIDFNINTFIGVSEYWYSSHDILGLGGAYDYAEFERKSAEFCNSEWEDIKARPDYQGQSQDRLKMQCFKSAWLSNVLHSGFGLPRYGEMGAIGSKEQSSEVLEKAEESIKNKNWRPPFQSINAIQDIQVTWTLGAMLLITSGSLGPFGGVHEGHKPTLQPLPPANHKAPHEDTYPERMLDSYNHLMLLAIVLCVLAIFWLYRSRSTKSWPLIKRWLTFGASSPGGSGGGGSGLPFFGRLRRTSGPSGADYSALESGTTGGSSAPYGRGFSPRASLKVMYLSAAHYTRSIWWSLSSRIWPEPRIFNTLDGRSEEMIESITIAGYDGNSSTSTTIPMTNVAGHHGGTPAGSFGSSGLSSIPEGGQGPFDPGYHRAHSSPASTISGGSSRPPKTGPKFFRINKKRFSGDSQSLFVNKDGRGTNQTSADGCVVNTALLQKQAQSSVELTARSGSSTNLTSLWSGNNLSNNNLSSNTNTTPNYFNSNNNSNGSSPQPPMDHMQLPPGASSSGVTSTWKQGWVPEEEDEAPIPSLLSTSRSHNNTSSNGHSPLLTPMARYKQQQLLHQDGSSSAPSSTVNLGSHTGVSSSGFVTSADEREEWSADGGGDGDDEGDGYLDQYHAHPHSRTGMHNSNSYQQFQQQAQMNQQQYSSYPTRSASAIPFGNSPSSSRPSSYSGGVVGLSHSQSSHAVPTAGSSSRYSFYKQRSTGLLSGINFESGGGAMTTMDDGESASEGGGGGYLSGGSGGLLPVGARLVGSRSASPMMMNQQQNSTSTSSLVLGRHNVSEQDQQLVSRGSSENLRRGSMGTVMSP